MRISVVIRCFNEEAHIGRLLTGIGRQRTSASEIIVVDSGSTDATLAIASAFPVKVVQIKPSDFSFGAACNVGVEHAMGDAVVFISAHCYPVYDTWLELLVKPLESDPRTVLSYGRQYGPPGARFSEQRIFARWFPEESARPQTHPFCNNANLAIRRETWVSLRYDESLTGLEDLDWARRTIEAGNVIAYVAEAPVIHVHQESFGQIARRYQREALAHQRIFPEQRMTRLEAARLGVLNIASDLVVAAGQRRLLSEAVDIIRFRTAQFLGTSRGFAQEGPVPVVLRRRFFYPETAAGAMSDADGPGTRIDYEAAGVAPADQHAVD